MRQWLARRLYSFYKWRAPDYQQEHLPPTYKIYSTYQSRYGVAPGDSFETKHGEVVVVSVSGPSTGNASITYKELDTDEEYQTGIMAFQHMVY